ncbi:MAG: hypothetical protein OEO20_06485 [Gemmatimonadota bacterium]|nr:hypothetical protein [Gemmatimonadota bacterium]MDH3368756.1 hypothetical protein [Gemmatimonadota bacterium]MDH3477932.1 hypothetical protein [Gemmatimonadota bacterium]MDH5550773.1 hypothetical protein [Gemmatimonadota bacterium]
MSEPTYDEESRTARLRDLLRGLAARIRELDADGSLLRGGPELLKLMGDARSELFHYEVRCTYDSPEAARNRRLVDRARRQMEHLDFGADGVELGPDDDDEEPWRSR